MTDALQSAVTNAATAQAQTAPKRESAVDREELQEDYDNFLHLFLTQLQNQDPLSPLDNNEFTNSLANLSQVEQAVKTNERLEDLVDLGRNKVSDYGDPVSFIGKQIQYDAEKFGLAEEGTGLHYTVSGEPDKISVVIKDASGRTVLSEEVQPYPGEQIFLWDGKDNSLRDVPLGEYSAEVTAITGEDTEKLDVTARGNVTEAAFDGEDISLKVGGAYIALETVRKVRESNLAEAN